MADDLAIKLKLQDQAQTAAGLKDTASQTGKVGDAAKDAGKDAGKLAAGFDDAAKGMKGADGNAKGLKDSLKEIHGVAAVAAGGLAALGVAGAIGVQESSSKLDAQLGVTGARAGAAGKLAGDLYANNYGESLDQASGYVRGVVQNLGRDLTDSQVTTFGSMAANLESAFEVPVDETTRAVASLVNNGLAPSFTKAFDIITTGFTRGADSGGEFLDSLNEYAAPVKTLGLNAEEFTAMLVNGLDNGAFSVDKIGDAVKEFSILAVDGSKSTASALSGLGLDADTTSEAIARGGPEARSAMHQVVDALRGVQDPLKRSQLGVSLFGATFEDLKGDAILGLDPVTSALGKVDGAAQQMGDTLSDNAGSKIETFKRRALLTFENALGGVVIPVIEKYMDVIAPFATVTGIAGVAVVGLTTATWLWNAALAANPVGLVVIGVVALAAGLYVAYQRSETFREGVQATLGWLHDHGQWLLGPFGLLGRKLFELLGGFDGIRDKGVAAFDGVKSAVDWVGGAIDFVLGKADALIGKLDKIASKANPLDGGFGKSVGNFLGVDLTPSFNVPGFATGGVIGGSGMGIVGENGPELFEKNGGQLRITPLPAVTAPSLSPASTSAAPGGAAARTVYLLLSPDGRRVIGEMVDERNDRRDSRS